jgi:L-talarate/galactarate dehydratase
MSVESNVVSYANDLSAETAADRADRIAYIRLSHCVLPLATPVSDAKVLTGRQKPMTEIAFIFCEIETQSGASGIGFGYSKRAGGPGRRCQRHCQAMDQTHVDRRQHGAKRYDQPSHFAF